jgi:TolB-like protein/Tfp pilus assembly protein PilF
MIYLIGAWVVIQVVETTFSTLMIPQRVNTAIILLIIAGLPLTIVLAWAYEVTPHGIGNGHVYEKPTKVRRFIEFGLVSTVIISVGFATYHLVRYVGERQAETQGQVLTGESPVFGVALPIPDNSIAVLPFVNMSDERSNEYFGDGLSEEILNLLTKLKELKVASRTSTFYFKGKDVDLRTIGQRLGVRYILEGSIRRQDDNIRVTAQLIDTSSGFHSWSETYERTLNDIFVIQDDISHKIVQQLEIILSPESDRQLARRATLSVDAFDTYLQGLAKLRGPFSEANLTEAEALFQSAVAIDPNYAEAYAGLCDVHLERYGENGATSDFELAEKACHRALALENTASPVYIALGNLYRESGEYRKSEMEYESAIELNPNSVEAYLGLAQTNGKQNRLPEAERNFHRVLELQPQFWRGHLEMGNFLFSSGRSAEAINHYRFLTEMTPENGTVFNSLGAAYFMVGRFDDATTAWQESLRLLPNKETYSNLGSGLFYAGHYEEATEMYRKGIEIAPDEYYLWGHLGDAYTATNVSADLARSAYQKAIKRAEDRLIVNPADAEAIATLGHYYSRVDERQRAIESLARANELAPQDIYVKYDSAVAWTTLGDYDRALDAIEQAVTLGYPPHLLRPDAGLWPLLEFERFKVLIPSELGE